MTSSLQTLQGEFPASAVFHGNSYVLLDTVNAGGGWSMGSQLVFPLNAQPTIVAPWTILGYSISFTGFNLVSISSTDSMCAKLGRLYGGLLSGGIANIQPARAFGGLPTNSTNISELWDGASDPMFPNLGAGNVTPVLDTRTVTAELPQSLFLGASDQISMGIWLTPSLGPPIQSLTTQLFLGIVTASYAVQYVTGPYNPNG